MYYCISRHVHVGIQKFKPMTWGRNGHVLKSKGARLAKQGGAFSCWVYYLLLIELRALAPLALPTLGEGPD